MRLNEYKSLDEFMSQYTGECGPSEGHWYGLDFSYHGTEYRLHTWSMYKDEIKILPDGRDVLFGLYKKVLRDDEVSSEHRRKYELLGKYADMHDLLESRVIEGIPFSEVIMDDYTELLGQD